MGSYAKAINLTGLPGSSENQMNHNCRKIAYTFKNIFPVYWYISSLACITSSELVMEDAWGVKGF